MSHPTPEPDSPVTLSPTPPAPPTARLSASWTLEEAMSLAPDRQWACAIYHPATDSVFFFGSQLGNSIFGDQWLWKDGRWRTDPDSTPVPRMSNKLVIDPTSGHVFMFGGLGREPFGDSWSWDGSAWRQHEGPGPSARYGHRMVAEPLAGTVLLFGGSGRDGQLNDPWTWDGVDWHPLATAISPGSRVSHVMAYHPVSDAFWLFGGYDERSRRADLWRLDMR